MDSGVHWTQPEMEAIPRKWLEVVVHFLSGFRNDTVDFGRPHLRPSVERVYPFFVVLYAALVVCGTAANVALLVAVFSLRAALPGAAAGRSRRQSEQEAQPRTVSDASAPRDQQKQRTDGGRSGGEGGRREQPRRRSGVGCGRDPTLCFLANVAVANVVKCLMVLPVSLAVLLVQNWVFGRFLCFFLPMMQDIPIHVTMLSFLLIAADRHRLLMDPMKPRLPPIFCSLSAWLLALCIVLPYPIYTTYLDLGDLKKEQFEGVGICAVNLGDDLQEYMRGLFIAMYVLPLAVIAFLYVRVSRELKMLRLGAEESAALTVRIPAERVASLGTGSSGRVHTPVGSRSPLVNVRTGGQQVDLVRSTSSCAISGRDLETGGREAAALTGGSRGGQRGGSGYQEEEHVDTLESEVGIRREQRTQKYLIAMVVTFAICLFPLIVLRLAKLALTETYENSGHFDIAFIIFVWVAFLPTLSTPCLYYSWTINSVTTERLRKYFHLGPSGNCHSEDDREYEEVDEEEGGGGGNRSGCAALLLGSRRRRRRNRRRDVCRLTPQQPHHSASDAPAAMSLNNVAFTHPPPPPAAPDPHANMVVGTHGTADVMGSPFDKGSFS